MAMAMTPSAGSSDHLLTEEDNGFHNSTHISEEKKEDLNGSHQMFVALGYKHGRPKPGGTSWKPKLAGMLHVCHRCGKTVYPVEKIDVGVVYHRGCFKCCVCRLQLTLRNFHRELDPKSSSTKEVYCATHVPKTTAANLGQDAMGIKAALEAQKRASHRMKSKYFDSQKGWNFDPYTHNVDLDEEIIAENIDEESNEEENDRDDGYVDYDPQEEAEREKENRSPETEAPSYVRMSDIPQDPVPVTPVKDSTPLIQTEDSQPTPKTPVVEDKPPPLPPPNKTKTQIHRTPEGTCTINIKYNDGKGPSHLSDRKLPEPPPPPVVERTDVPPPKEQEKPIMKLKRRSTLKSVSDFEKFGVFNAQSALETLHKQEEDELYRQIFEERQQQIKFLEQEIADEKARSVQELIEWFETQGMRSEDREIGLRKAQQFWKEQKEERMRKLLQRLAIEEQAAVARMVEKHSSEMLLLIAEKDKQATLQRQKKTTEETDNDINEETTTVDLSIPPEQPDIVPPDDSKSALYETPDVFQDFDKQAIKETKREHKTFTDLVRRLSKRCETELQVVRAIFRWITAKDLNQMHFDETVDPDSPLGILRGVKYGTESYHDLFKRLCSYAGLHCVIIDGYSKGAGYKPGTNLGGSTFKNQWTAVNVDGSWRFINCNWGARHVKGPQQEEMTYKCDEFYFLTDPEDHIYQHFPDDKSWQLLKKPISLKQFVQFPIVKSPFFNNKLTFVKHCEAVMPAYDGFMDIELKCSRFLDFAAKLQAKGRHVPSEVLKERTLVRRKEKSVIVSVNLPAPGQYYLSVYVSDDFETRSMDSALSIMVYCTNISADAHITYPQIGCFGPTPYFRKFKLGVQTHSDPLVNVCGETGIAFLTNPAVKLSHSLKIWHLKERRLIEFDRYAFQKYQSDKLATYLISCPRPGLYVFSLFAESADYASSGSHCVYNYLLDCRTPCENPHPMPRASRRWKHCKLIEPFTGDLATNSNVKFQLQSETAIEICVSVHKEWQTLKHDGKAWIGTVYTGQMPGRAVVYARHDSTTQKYIPLLEYEIKDTGTKFI